MNWFMVSIWLAWLLSSIAKNISSTLSDWRGHNAAKTATAAATRNPKSHPREKRILLVFATANLLFYAASFALLLWIAHTAPARVPTVRETALLLLLAATMIIASRPPN